MKFPLIAPLSLMLATIAGGAEKPSATASAQLDATSLMKPFVILFGQGPHPFTVVPDSGTGELTGLTGSMEIKIAVDGTHTYVFEYSFASAP